MLDAKTVKQVAALARVELSGGEVERFRAELAEVLEFFEALKAAPTEGVVPTAHASGLLNVLAPDRVASCSVPPATLLKNAPLLEKGFLKVPVVLEGER